jgi:hypothetical protein
VTDVGTIRVLQDALRDLSLNSAAEGGTSTKPSSVTPSEAAEQSMKLWERAAAAMGVPKTSDEEGRTKNLLMTWLNSSIQGAEGDGEGGSAGWKGAQKVWFLLSLRSRFVHEQPFGFCGGKSPRRNMLFCLLTCQKGLIIRSHAPRCKLLTIKPTGSDGPQESLSI